MGERLFRRYLFLFLGVTTVVTFLLASQESFTKTATDKVITALSEMGTMENAVLPDQDTVLHEPYPGKICPDLGLTLFLLLVVISAPENGERREVIRDTFEEMRGRWEEGFWEAKESSNARDLEIKEVFQVIFFVGQAADLGVSEKVNQEAIRHGDLVVDRHPESYLKLTVKTLRMFKWVLHNCHDAKYLVKMDDDVYLNVPKLFPFLLNQPSSYNPELIAGHLYPNIAPDRDPTSKWYSPPSLWREPTFPPFVAGFCYIMALPAVKLIFEESRQVPLFHLEDVFVTGIVASQRLHLNLTRAGDTLPNFYKWHVFDKNGSWPGLMLIVHNVPLRYFRCWTEDRDRERGWPLILTCRGKDNAKREAVEDNLLM